MPARWGSEVCRGGRSREAPAGRASGHGARCCGHGISHAPGPRGPARGHSAVQMYKHKPTFRARPGARRAPHARTVGPCSRGTAHGTPTFTVQPDPSRGPAALPATHTPPSARSSAEPAAPTPPSASPGSPSCRGRAHHPPAPVRRPHPLTPGTRRTFRPPPPGPRRPLSAPACPSRAPRRADGHAPEGTGHTGCERGCSAPLRSERPRRSRALRRRWVSSHYSMLHSSAALHTRTRTRAQLQALGGVLPPPRPEEEVLVNQNRLGGREIGVERVPFSRSHTSVCCVWQTPGVHNPDCSEMCPGRGREEEVKRF